MKEIEVGDVVVISPTWKKDKPKKATVSNGFEKTLNAHAKYRTKFVVHNISRGALYNLKIYNLREEGKEKPMDKAIYEGMIVIYGE